MNELKIPNLNKNSDKFYFKKKLSLRRKSKSKLIKESFIMLSFSIFIIYINYLIPNKVSILNNLSLNLKKLTINALGSLSYIYEICLAMFIILSLIMAFILVLGSFYRVFKISRKSKRIFFK